MATHSALRAHRLHRADERQVRALLDADPVANVYLRSELRSGLGSGDWWGIDGDDGRLRSVALSGSLVVPCMRDPRDAIALAEASASSAPARIIVGPRDAAMALHAAFGRPARDVRDHQVLLAVDRTALPATAPAPVRQAAHEDIDGLVVAAAAMHHEEMGIDPMSVDASWWRARMSSLIDRGWSWVWTDRGEVVFKAELSARTDDVVQLQGVYTAPRYRRLGLARHGIAAICRALFAGVPLVSLYANEHNQPALSLYGSLGFEGCGEYATVIY